MQPRLKEDPREWQKFALVLGFGTLAITTALWWRQRLSGAALSGIGVSVGFGLAAAWIRPRWFRGIYRGGMTASFYVGQVMGRILLTLFFLVVITPLGWFLRLVGHDLLQIKRDPRASTYWQPAKNRHPNHFERQF